MTKEFNELTDEELNQVSGGGSGTIPQGGITFKTYDALADGHYYSQEKNFSEVVYVYLVGGTFYYTREAFSVTEATNTWSSRCRTPSGKKSNRKCWWFHVSIPICIKCTT